jgi:hypothetical protein
VLREDFAGLPDLLALGPPPQPERIPEPLQESEPEPEMEPMPAEHASAPAPVEPDQLGLF